MADSLNYTDPRGMMADRYASQYTPLSGSLDQMTVQLGGNAGALLGNALFGGQSSAMMEQRAINDAIKEADAAEDPDERLSLFAQALRKRGLEGRAQDVESKLATRLKDRAATKKSQYEMEQDQASFQMRFSALKARDPNISDEEARGIASDADIFKEKMKDPDSKFVTETVDNQVKLYKVTPNGYEFVKSLGAKGKSDVGELAGAVGKLAAGLAGEQAKSAGSKGGALVGEATAKVGAGYRSLDAISDALETVESGIYAGGYGPLEEAAAKYTKGVLGNQDRLVNTEAFRAYIGNVVIPMMQQLGGSDSNEELKKMEAIAGGNTKLETAAIKRILKSARTAIKNDLARLEKQQEAVMSGQPLPLGPVGSQNTPRATKKYNPATGKLETIKER